MSNEFDLTGYGVYEFYGDFGKMGSLEGVFLAKAEDVKKLAGKYANFGEVLGKHSDISGTIKASDLRLKSDDTAVVKVLYDLFGTDVSGFNPFDYVSEDQWDEDEEEFEVED